MSYSWILILTITGLLTYAGVFLYIKFKMDIPKNFKRETKIKHNYLNKLTNGYTEGWEQSCKTLPNGRVLVTFAPTDIEDGKNPMDFLQTLILEKDCRVEKGSTGKGKKSVIYYSPFESDYPDEEYQDNQHQIDKTIKKSKISDIRAKKQKENVKLTNEMIKQLDYEAPVKITKLFEEATKKALEMIQEKKPDIKPKKAGM